MNIEIKKSIKPIKYEDAIKLLEERLLEINNGQKEDLIWILEHEEVYSAGTSYKEKEILNKDINLVKTNRGGKITYHGPGQLICYFVIDLKKRKKDIRKFITLIEETIINSLSILRSPSLNVSLLVRSGCKGNIITDFPQPFLIYFFKPSIPPFLFSCTPTRLANFTRTHLPFSAFLVTA